MRKIYPLTVLLLIPLLLCGCDTERAPEGMVYFCRVQLRHNGETVYAWGSKWKPVWSKASRNIYVYGDGSIQYTLDSDTKAPNDSKILLYELMKEEKLPEVYGRYKDNWLDIKGIHIEENVPPKTPDRPAKKEVQLERGKKKTYYTYEIRRTRGSDFKYRYTIFRSDGENVISLESEMEANRLIPFLAKTTGD